jgi:hypothetical protein
MTGKAKSLMVLMAIIGSAFAQLPHMVGQPAPYRSRKFNKPLCDNLVKETLPILRHPSTSSYLSESEDDLKPLAHDPKVIKMFDDLSSCVYCQTVTIDGKGMPEHQYKMMVMTMAGICVDVGNRGETSSVVDMSPLPELQDGGSSFQSDVPTTPGGIWKQAWSSATREAQNTWYERVDYIKNRVDDARQKMGSYGQAADMKVPTTRQQKMGRRRVVKKIPTDQLWLKRDQLMTTILEQFGEFQFQIFDEMKTEVMKYMMRFARKVSALTMAKAATVFKQKQANTSGLPSVEPTAAGSEAVAKTNSTLPDASVSGEVSDKVEDNQAKTDAIDENPETQGAPEAPVAAPIDAPTNVTEGTDQVNQA